MNPLSNRLVLWSLAGLLAVGAGMVRAARQRRQVAARMRGRDDPGNQFGDAFSALARPAIAGEVRDMLARALRTDLSRLQPTDRLGVELGFDQTGGDEILSRLIFEIEGRYDISLPDVRTCKRLTFRQLVETVDRRHRRATAS